MFGAIVAAALLGQAMVYQTVPSALELSVAYGAPYGGQYPTIQYQYPYNYQPTPLYGYNYPYYTAVPYLRYGYAQPFVGYRGGLGGCSGGGCR